MRKFVDIVYVVASRLGGVGMGPIGYHSMRGVENSSKLTYKIFCRGYGRGLKLNKKSVNSYGFLEVLSYPFRFLEKSLGLKIDAFKLVNFIFGKFIYWNLPKSRIYHTWINIAKEAAIKAKKQGSILVLEGGNSPPINVARLLNDEYSKYDLKEFLINEEDIKEKSRFYQKFDYVICPSDFVYKSYLNNGFKKKQLIKLSYGIDIKKFSSKKERYDQKFRAVFVGSVQLRKGIQYLLKAWDELKLKNAELIILGRIWPDAKKAIEPYKNNKTIKFVGFAGPKEYYKKSDVFVFPSIEEGSALVTYEAMASGLPLITTFNSGSVARNGKEGFIIPIRDVGTLKQKILYFYNNPKKAENMGKAARKRVEKYSWDKQGKRLVEVYKKILKNENRNPGKVK